MIHIQCKNRSINQSIFTKIVLQCPFCGNNGTFEVLGEYDQVINNVYIVGERKCPNSKCEALIFFLKDNRNDSFYTHPSVKINIDKENIPEKILKIFEEAVICHSNACYTAAGMLIRKTLEAICDDKGAKGVNLHQKLENLKSIITVPNELLEGMQILKLLGNDAAHIEAKTFDTISTKEIEVSIRFTKEILKAVYQFKSLLNELIDLQKQIGE